MVVVCGPRIDPTTLPPHEDLEVRAYVHNLYRHLAACDLAIVQGRLTTCMELTATARMAMQAPRERHAYVALLDPGGGRADGMATVDLDPVSPTYGEIVHSLDMPDTGDELHHFGWNVCSAALCPYAPHPHLERRYLVVPGLRSSRIYILDTKYDPLRPTIVKTIEPETVFERTGYSRPHTVHCGPDGIYVSALGNLDGDGPGGIFVLDHQTFKPLGRWEVDRGTCAAAATSRSSISVTSTRSRWSCVPRMTQPRPMGSSTPSPASKT